MALIDFIEKLQQKPRYVRLQIMWLGTILGGLAIFAFWLWSMNVLLVQPSKNIKQTDKGLESLTEIKNEMPGLWQSLSAGIGNVIDTAKEEMNGSPSAMPSATPTESQPAGEKLPIEQ